MSGAGLIGGLIFFVAFAVAGLVVRVRPWSVVLTAAIVWLIWIGGALIGSSSEASDDDWKAFVFPLAVASIAGALIGVLLRHAARRS